MTLFSLLCLAHGAQAQNVLFDDLQVPQGFTQPTGIAMGSLQLEGEVGTGVMTTNNVYRDVSHLASEALQSGLTTTLTSTSDRHLLVGTLEYFRQDFRDDTFQDLDMDVSTMTLFGRFVTSKLTNLRLLVIDEEDILGKDQSDQLNSFNSGLEHNKRYEAIFEVDNTRYFANMMWRYDQVDSRSFSSTATETQNEALDRSERDAIFLAGRHFGWGKAFLFGGTQAVRYESSSDPTLAERNSDENRYGVGIEYQMGKFSGDADIYRFTQEFDSITIQNIDKAWVGSGTLNFAASDRLTLLGAIERRFHETNIPGSGGIFSQNIFAGAAYSLTPDLYLRVGPSYNTARIQNTPVQLQRYEFDIELGWMVTHHFKLLFTTNVFMQEPENRAFAGTIAQQANSVLTISYSL
jgi:hypothetical protein